MVAKIRHNSVLCQEEHSKSFAFLLLSPWFEDITYVFGGEKKAQIWRNTGESEEVGIVVRPPSIALVNTIRKPADTIRKSADSLIVFSNAIRRSTLRVIASAEASSRQERAWHLS